MSAASWHPRHSHCWHVPQALIAVFQLAKSGISRCLRESVSSLAAVFVEICSSKTAGNLQGKSHCYWFAWYNPWTQKIYFEMTRVESTLQLLTHMYNNLHHLHNPKILNWDLTVMLFHSSISCTIKSTQNSPPNQLPPANLFFLGANFADIALPEMNISPENWWLWLAYVQGLSWFL